jgi:hypothetical protein
MVTDSKIIITKIKKIRKNAMKCKISMKCEYEGMEYLPVFK